MIFLYSGNRPPKPEVFEVVEGWTYMRSSFLQWVLSRTKTESGIFQLSLALLPLIYPTIQCFLFSYLPDTPQD